MMNCATCALRQTCSESRAKHIPIGEPPSPPRYEKVSDFWAYFAFIGVWLLMVGMGYTITAVVGSGIDYRPIVIEAPRTTPLASDSNQSGPPMKFVFAESARPAPIAGAQKIFEKERSKIVKVAK